MVPDISGIKDMITDEIEACSDQLWAMALDMHENPEVGHEEYRAAALLSGFLEERGFSVQRGLAGMDTSFRARWNCGDGPVVAILAEYDALPGMGHACGHNIIGASAVGAGAVLKQALERAGVEQVGEVQVIGTPAEEGAVDGAGGKVPLVESGAFDRVDCAMMVHPSTGNGSRSTSLAREAMEISYHGKASHAGGSPHQGRNALEAAILTFNAWNALRQHVTDDVRIHGIITEGGSAPNIVPEFSEIRMYVRAADVDYLDEVVERVKNCARGAATATGCTVEFRTTCYRYANLVCNNRLADAYSANFQVLGETIDDSLRAGSGSTDMGNVSQVVPSIHPYVAIAQPGVAGHSVEFRAAAAEEGGRRGMILGAAAMAMTALDCLTDEKLLESIKEEFLNR